MLRIVILSLVLSGAIGYSFAAWVAPSGAPPSGNPPPPINVGSSSQVRDGNLYLNNYLVAKKIQTASTLQSDPDKTVVTKDYAVARESGNDTIVKGYPCYGGGTSGDPKNNVVVCDDPTGGQPRIPLKYTEYASGATPDEKIKSWNLLVDYTYATSPGTPGFTWLNDQCHFILPADPVTGTYKKQNMDPDVFYELCVPWVGKGAIRRYYDSMALPLPSAASKPIIQLTSHCFRTTCNPAEPGTGGGWSLTGFY